MLLVVFLIADIIWRILQISMMHSVLDFPVLRYCREVYLPIIVACIPIILCLIGTSYIQIDSFWGHIGHLFLVFILTAFSAYYLGLQKEERRIVVNQVAYRFCSR